jgi:hypothetical protein
MKKLFITGGCGYVGSLMIQNFLDKYIIKNVDTQWFGNKLKEGKNLTNIKVDIRNLSGDFIDKNTYAVIHLANIANDPSVELDQTLSWEVNVLAAKKLIEESKVNDLFEKSKNKDLFLSKVNEVVELEDKVNKLKKEIDKIEKDFNKDGLRVYVERCELEGGIKDILITRAAELAQKMNFDWMLYLDADEFLVINNDKITNVKQL